ncbi:MAG: hypothetical protein CVV27_10750 [Candidatus Melainabacteria bacterium HGW-Melainabacteria-1]|nr:MAG: hypothetical protein CVV27_10750 [Candidatus Melainabacteria bacterium HGW-Melainabacteria-1]
MEALSLDALKQHLGYQAIEEATHEGLMGFLCWKSPYRFREYRILQQDPDAPPITLLFNIDLADGKLSLIQLGFGSFHMHFESGSDEADLLEALSFAARLISGELALMATLDKQGRYLGGQMRKRAEFGEPAPNQRLYVFNSVISLG